MTQESNNNKELIESVLKNENQDIAFEPIPGENESPLAQPVLAKENTSTGPPSNNTPNAQDPTNIPGNAPKTEKFADAPEQEINASAPIEGEASNSSGNPEGFAIPLEQAQLLADTMLGVGNNLLEVGAGYFITIRKHKDFYDFEEVIQIIDEQNVKNIRRIKLDEEDKALLRPLLVQVLRKQSKVMSVEQQLLGVALSIIIKKAKMIMEIRAENEVMVDRIREVIRREVGAAPKNDTENTPNQASSNQNEKEAEYYDERGNSGEHSENNQFGINGSVVETAITI